MVHKYFIFRLFHGIYLYFISPKNREIVEKTAHDIEMVVLDMKEITDGIKTVENELEDK